MSQVYFMLAYLLLLVAIGIYLLVLATRFVNAHRRGADALVEIARKMDRFRQE
jgi:hypothetical protein